jgi:hypothetical protein
MEDNLNYLGKWKKTSIIYANERRTQLFRQMKNDIIFFKEMEDNLNFLINGRRFQFTYALHSLFTLLLLFDFP